MRRRVADPLDPSSWRSAPGGVGVGVCSLGGSGGGSGEGGGIGIGVWSGKAPLGVPNRASDPGSQERLTLLGIANGVPKGSLMGKERVESGPLAHPLGPDHTPPSRKGIGWRAQPASRPAGARHRSGPQSAAAAVCAPPPVPDPGLPAHVVTRPIARSGHGGMVTSWCHGDRLGAGAGRSGGGVGSTT